MSYTAIWFEAEGQQESVPFEDFDELKLWAESTLNPFENGAVMPNVPTELMGDDDTFAGRRYEAGLYAHGNRYAVIVHN